MDIPDLSKSWFEKVNVSIPEGRHIYKVKVDLDGNLHSQAKLNGQLIGPGEIQMNVKNGDYYGSDYLFEYEPFENNGGALTITITFYFNYLKFQ